MPAATSVSERPAVIRVDLGAIFVSLELSRKWLITSLVAGRRGEDVEARGRGRRPGGAVGSVREAEGEGAGEHGPSYRIVGIQEAGLDGFWIHRALENEGIESYVVDPASIATSRRKRRAKTDKIDGEALVRALLA